jgi:hypothetical protein
MLLAAHHHHIVVISLSSSNHCDPIAILKLLPLLSLTLLPLAVVAALLPSL